MLMYLAIVIVAGFTPASLIQGDDSSTVTCSTSLITAPEEEEEKPGEEPLYPKLKGFKKDKCKQLLTAFKNRNPKKREKAVKDMVALGRAVIPRLVENGETKDPTQSECIYSCLLKLTDKRDLKLFNDGYGSKATAMRMLAVVKIADLKNREFQNFLKAALKDDDASIRLEAALGLAWLKDPSGIGEIIVELAKDLKFPQKRLLAPLPQFRGERLPPGITKYVISEEDPKIRTAAVVTLTEIGDPSKVRILKKALNDAHHQVQRATINGLRKLVDNDEPREYETLFELVEEVNAWKKRLSSLKREQQP